MRISELEPGLTSSHRVNEHAGMAAPHRLDVLILGGGAAGLWLLDDLHRQGYSVALVEASALGTGQTIWSQGIIHGGLKYALHGRAGKAARAIRGMPLRWRRSLAGERTPDLTQVRRRAEYCCIWATRGIRSRIGLMGASLSLSVKPKPLDRDSRPSALRDWNGPVLRLGEQVIEPGSFLQVLADNHLKRILKVEGPQGIELEASPSGHVREVHLRCPGGRNMTMIPDQVILAAGEGNSRIRNRLGLPVEHIQQRPLQMIMASGTLPIINGHCIRHASPWLTITSTRDHADRVVWQIGGQVAEDMARSTRQQAIDRAIDDLKTALPGLDLSDVRFSTYLASRAEGSSSGKRPDRPTVFHEENVLTAWPTKLALVPMLSEMIMEQLSEPSGTAPFEMPNDWPTAAVAIPPWELESTWTTVH